MAFIETAALRVLGVFDAAKPNLERIVLRPTEQTNLAGVGITVGLSNGLIFHDHVFWFPQIIVEPPTWIFVYTGAGSHRQTTVTGTREPALVYHWNRPRTIFNNVEFRAVLFRMSEIDVGLLH